MSTDNTKKQPTKSDIDNTPSKKVTVAEISLNGKTWTARNLDIEIPGQSWCYNNQEANCQKHGRLYTWAAAREACQNLGNGWRLPNEQEWSDLAKSQGGFTDNRTKQKEGSPEEAYKNLRNSFNTTLAGYRYSKSSFNGLEVQGSYWTTSGGLESATVFLFHSDTETLIKNRMPKSQAISCRCIKD